MRGDPLDSDRAPGAQPWPGPEAAEGSEPGEAARCCHRFSRDQRELQPERLCSSHPPRPPPLTGASETQPSLSLTRSSLPPAYFHILLYSRALLKPHSYPEFGLRCCYCATGINSYPFHSLMLFSRFLRLSCLCSFPFLQRQGREEGQQRAKSARAASGDR